MRTQSFVGDQASLLIICANDTFRCSLFAVISNVLSTHGRYEGDSFDFQMTYVRCLGHDYATLLKWYSYLKSFVFCFFILLKVFLSNLWRRSNAMDGAWWKSWTRTSSKVTSNRLTLNLALIYSASSAIETARLPIIYQPIEDVSQK